jgi:hypothetical protein
VHQGDFSSLARRAISIVLGQIRNNNNNNNNSIVYYLCAESTATRQLQTQHIVNTGNYIMDKHNINSKTNYRQALEEKHINAEK